LSSLKDVCLTLIKRLLLLLNLIVIVKLSKPSNECLLIEVGHYAVDYECDDQPQFDVVGQVHQGEKTLASFVTVEQEEGLVGEHQVD